MCSQILFALLLVCFILTISYAQKDEKIFRKDYKYLEETRSFYKFHTLPLTWTDAKRMCAWESAELFYPDDDDEAMTVFTYWNETQAAVTWISVGISDLIVRGSLVTVDGKPVSEVYNNWFPGEPNDSRNDERCIISHISGLFNDDKCVSKHPYICKKRLQNVEWNRPCNMTYLGYVYSEPQGKCYNFHKTAMSWTDAFKVCTAQQSYLAVINSQSERDHLISLLPGRTDEIAHDISNETIHLGFHNRLGEGWQTVQGTILDDAGYARWGEDQPDSTSQDVNEKCGAMSYTGQLNDISCEKKSFFICERDVNTHMAELSEGVLEQL